MRLLKRLLCRHEWQFERNIYGDEINAVGGYRSWWRCPKCGKRFLDPRLYPSFEPELPPLSERRDDGHYDYWE